MITFFYNITILDMSKTLTSIVFHKNHNPFVWIGTQNS